MHLYEKKIHDVWIFNKSFHVFLSLSSTYHRREITALQVENYSLERQLLSYQKSLAMAHRAHNSDDLDDEYYNNHDHYYDRSLSEAQSFSESEYV